MSTKELTDYQLYCLINNRSLNSSLRNIAMKEFRQRQIPTIELQNIQERHINQFGTDLVGLGKQNKVILVVFPFVWLIQIVFQASKYLAHNQYKKWRDFWLYVTIGWAMWTLAVLVYVSFR